MRRAVLASAAVVGLSGFGTAEFAWSQAPEAGSGVIDDGNDANDSGIEDGEAEGAGAPESAAPLPLDSFFDGITATNLESRVNDAYAADIVYQDPMGTFTGQAAVLDHWRSLLTGVQKIDFDPKEEFVTGAETVVVWAVTLRHDRLGDDDVHIDGMTKVRLKSGKIIEQRDYYDLGSAVYEHVTLVGTLVRWVKAKL